MSQRTHVQNQAYVNKSRCTYCQTCDHTRTLLHTPKNRRAKKFQGVRQIARRKQRFLFPTFLQRSYEKSHVYLLFHWFSGENCIIFTFSLHKGRQISTN